MIHNKQGKGMVLAMLVILVIFAFAFISMFSYKILDDLQPDLNETFIESVPAQNALIDVHTRFPGTFDGLVATVFFLLWAFLTVAAFFADEHPVLFIFMVIIGIFIIIAAMLLGNFYEELFLDDSLSGLADEFPITNWILSNMLIVSMILIFSVLAGLYGKNLVG